MGSGWDQKSDKAENVEQEELHRDSGVSTSTCAVYFTEDIHCYEFQVLVWYTLGPEISGSLYDYDFNVNNN